MRVRGLLLFVLALSLNWSCSLPFLRSQPFERSRPQIPEIGSALPSLDRASSVVLGRMLAKGGLSRAAADTDGVTRAAVAAPADRAFWKPAVIVMRQPGPLQLAFENEGRTRLTVVMPETASGPARLELPLHARRLLAVTLERPGLYWFGCPDAANAGMLGLVLVEGDGRNAMAGAAETGGSGTARP